MEGYGLKSFEHKKSSVICLNKPATMRVAYQRYACSGSSFEEQAGVYGAHAAKCPITYRPISPANSDDMYQKWGKPWKAQIILSALAFARQGDQVAVWLARSSDATFSCVWRMTTETFSLQITIKNTYISGLENTLGVLVDGEME